MNSVNSSLLESESVFIQLSGEELVQQNIFLEQDDCGKDNQQNSSHDGVMESQVSISENLNSAPIQLTQTEAMRLLNLAASIIQAKVKSYFQLKKYKNFQLEMKAAVKIQALWRGYHTRNLDASITQLRYNYITCHLQNQILNLEERYRNDMSVVKSERNVLIETLIKLCGEIEELKSLNKMEKVDASTETCLEKSYISIVSETSLDVTGDNTSKVLTESTGFSKTDDIIKVAPDLEETPLTKVNAAQHVEVIEISSDDISCEIDEVVNDIVDNVINESLSEESEKESTRPDLSNECKAASALSSEVIDFSIFVDVEPLDNKLTNVANLESIEINFGASNEMDQ